MVCTGFEREGSVNMVLELGVAAFSLPATFGVFGELLSCALSSSASFRLLFGDLEPSRCFTSEKSSAVSRAASLDSASISDEIAARLEEKRLLGGVETLEVKSRVLIRVKKAGEC